MKTFFGRIGIILGLSIFLIACDPQMNDVSSNSQGSQTALESDFGTITRRLVSPAYGGVDFVSGVTSPKSGSVIQVTTDTIEIAGTYVDAEKGDVAAGVVVMINDKPYVATYGGERPDIAKTLNNPKYLKCQFYVSVPTAEVGKGVHKVKIRAIANDKSGYYESDWIGMLNVK